MTTANAAIDRVSGTWDQLKRRVQDEIVGLDDVIELLAIGVLSGGHCLLVGVPGLAKTLLVRTLADTFDLGFSRIQFTPDLMPSDIVGTEVIMEDTATGARHFRFMNGPIFANVVLADEINRTPPKTQAALMEAMEEHQVTVGGRRHALAPPFFVLATQNPIEQEGTYPLPAAQLDRFTFLIEVGYPNKLEERAIVRRTCAPRAPVDKPDALVTKEDILEINRLLDESATPPAVVERATELARATRPGEPGASPEVERFLSWGVGPRGAQALVRASKVRALLHGRGSPSIEDVHHLAPHAFRHRMMLNFVGAAEGASTDSILASVLEATDAKASEATRTA